MGQLYREVMRYIDRMDMNQWIIALGVVIVIGLVCMKGFGSRSKY